MWMIHTLLTTLFPPRCLGCGHASSPLCTRCIALSRKSLSTPEPYIISAFDFKDPLVRKAIHALKYYHRKDLILPLTEILAEEIKKMPLKHYVLVPIPMPPLRKLIRGYNQSERIAHELSRLLGFSVEPLLVRSKTPTRQAKLKNRADRLRNQKGSFALISDTLPDDIILIDDVATTGATLGEARTVLLKAGAKNVRGATLAH